MWVAYLLIVEDEEQSIKLHFADGAFIDHSIGWQNTVHAGVPTFLLQRGRVEVTLDWSIVETGLEHVHESLRFEWALQIQVLEFWGDHVIGDDEFSEHFVSVDLLVQIGLLNIAQFHVLEDVEDHLAVGSRGWDLEVLRHAVVHVFQILALKILLILG